MRLKDKTAVITGGGAGIGLGIVKLFAEHGANIVIADINTEAAEENTKGINGNIDIQKANVSIRSEIESVLDFAVEKYGKVDVLVNNAGILDNMTPIGEIEDSLWDKVMSVNLNGVMYASRRAVQIMEKQNGGSIINIASVCGVQGGRAGVGYTASKHAVVGLSKNIAFMYAHKDIRCNVLCPGSIKTDISTTALVNASSLGMKKALLGLPANPSHGTPEDIANIVLFLASDEAKFINGAAIVADSGWLAY